MCLLVCGALGFRGLAFSVFGWLPAYEARRSGRPVEAASTSAFGSPGPVLEALEYA